MQTPAELRLIRAVREFLEEQNGDAALLLNVGADGSVVVENSVDEPELAFRVDRVDIAECRVEHPRAGECFRCSVEAMEPIPDGRYDFAFSNYLLEHVPNLDAAAGELYRVLKPSAGFVASVPNPTAPEFVLAKHTPLWFHKLVRGYAVGEKYYSYENVPDLARRFRSAGFEVVAVEQYSSVEDYLQRFPLVRQLARLYDRTLVALRWRRFMGNACLIFRKPAS